jgi:hypothetical protein
MPSPVATARLAVLALIAFVVAMPVRAAAQGSGGDEMAAIKVVETASAAINKEDLQLLLAQFADDARIDSKAAQAKVSKDKYAEAMAAAFKSYSIVRVEHRDLRATLSDGTHASVLGTVYMTTKTARPVFAHEWKLEKRAGRWLIVETNYK